MSKKNITSGPAGEVNLSNDSLYEISTDSPEAQAVRGGNWWEWDGDTLLFGSCRVGTRGCCDQYS